MPAKHDDALPGHKLLELYQRLTLDNRRHFQADLARDLGRSAQAITRMIDVIEAHLGKDAYIERGLEGRRRYYRLRSKAEEKTLGFSFEELRYLATCRDIAAPFLPESVTARIDRTLATLALHLGDNRGEQPTGLPISFRSKGYIDYTNHLGTIAVLRDAIRKRQVCQISYAAAGRQHAKSYRFAAGRIEAMNGTLYVWGFRLAEGSLLKERPTTFSLHRISAATPTGEFFRFDASDMPEGTFGLIWHDPKRMQVHIAASAADYVRDRVWSEDQTIEDQPDGSTILTVTTASEKELLAWVMSFGGLATLLEAQTEINASALHIP